MLLRAGNLLRRRIVSAKLTAPTSLADHTQQYFNSKKLMDFASQACVPFTFGGRPINQVIIRLTDGITKKTIKQTYNEASHYLHNPHNKTILLGSLGCLLIQTFHQNLQSWPKGMRSVVQSKVLIR